MTLPKIAFAAAAILLVAAAAQAADRAVHLSVPPPVRRGIAAMPQITDPADAAERKINAAVRRFDTSVRKAAGECRSDGKPGDWGRTVDATMRGPGFLSFVINDNYDCGGAYPNTGSISIVYDLQTGNPVDWTKLLPASLTGDLSLDNGADGTKTVQLSAKRLYALYLTGIHYGKGANDTDPECKDVLEQPDNTAPPMSAWLDAKQGGLAVERNDLPHATAACEVPVVIPAATLRKEGASAVLTNAIEAAHAAR